MSLVWMAAIAIVCLAEKNWRHGPDLTALVGVTLIGLGLAILIHPPFLAALAPSA
jgi:predicted metal-binding membrane protein